MKSVGWRLGISCLLIFSAQQSLLFDISLISSLSENGDTRHCSHLDKNKIRLTVWKWAQHRPSFSVKFLPVNSLSQGWRARTTLASVKTVPRLSRCACLSTSPLPIPPARGRTQRPDNKPNPSLKTKQILKNLVVLRLPWSSLSFL